MAMTASALMISDELPLIIPAMAQPGQIQALVRDKLAALTRRLQLLIRSKPREMAPLLELYQHFLSAKEALERYFGPQQALCLAGPGRTGGRRTGKTRTTAEIPEWQQAELSGVTALLGRLQLHERHLQGCSRSLDVFFEELKNVVRLLEVYRRGPAPTLLPVPGPPAGNLSLRQVPPLAAASRAHSRSRATFV
jgi:hypothetical protein